MQNYQQTAKDSKQRSFIPEWGQFTISKFNTILFVCLISFTSLLVRQTLQVQHSCNPMIHWSGDLPAECQVATSNSLNLRDRQELPLPKQTHNQANTNDSKSNLKSSYSKTVSEPETQFNSHPNQITYGPPTPTVETLQNNTETKSKNIRDVLVEVVVAVKNFLWWRIKSLFP